MNHILLDSSVLSRYLDARWQNIENEITQRIDIYLREHPKLEFSVLSRFEKERGLKDLKATAQLDALDRLCRLSIVHPVNEKIVIKAADIWATLKQKGRKPSDVDTLIAATAAVEGCTIAHADRDFSNFQDFIAVENWLASI